MSDENNPVKHLFSFALLAFMSFMFMGVESFSTRVEVSFFSQIFCGKQKKNPTDVILTAKKLFVLTSSLRFFTSSISFFPHKIPTMFFFDHLQCKLLLFNVSFLVFASHFTHFMSLEGLRVS